MTAGRGAGHAEVVLENCRVPRECLLSQEGEGFAIAMRCLDAGRTHWGAYCVGAATQLLSYAVEHISQREAFGRKLRDNQGIEWMIADMASALHAARLVAYEAAWRYDNGDPAERTAAAALSKYTGAEMVQRIADNAAIRRIGILERPSDRTDMEGDARRPDPGWHVRNHAADHRAKYDQNARTQKHAVGRHLVNLYRQQIRQLRLGDSGPST